MLTTSAIAASLTAVHFALAMLRRHRSGRTFSPFVIPSFLVTITPWFMSSPMTLGGVLIAHILWVIVAEIIAPSAPLRPTAARPAATPARAQTAAQPAAPPAARTTSRPAAAAARPAVGFATATVLAVLEDTGDIKTFRLERPDGFEFVAGQFLAVKIQIDGKPHVRCYSISSAPDTRGYLEISVRKQGLVSSTLHATVRTGSRLSLNRPAGQFVYPSGDDRPLVLVAGGIGITPLMAMLRHAVVSDPTRPVTLLYSAKHQQDLAFIDELRVIALRHPQVRVALTLSRAQADARVRQGRIDSTMLRQHVADAAHTIFCLCGPKSMIADITATLAAMNVPRAQIRSEEFETAIAASVINAPARAHAAATAKASATMSSPPEGGGHWVTFASSGRTVMVPADQTLLETAELEGVAIASSCRAGICQACRTRVSDGQADCRSAVLDDADREAGYVLPCVTFATGDCVLEA